MRMTLMAEKIKLEQEIEETLEKLILEYGEIPEEYIEAINFFFETKEIWDRELEEEWNENLEE